MGRNLVFRGLPVHTGNSPIIASLGRAWLGPGCHLFVTAEPRVSTVYRRCSPIILVSVRRGSILLLCLFVCLFVWLVFLHSYKYFPIRLKALRIIFLFVFFVLGTYNKAHPWLFSYCLSVNTFLCIKSVSISLGKISWSRIIGSEERVYTFLRLVIQWADYSPRRWVQLPVGWEGLGCMCKLMSGNY